jgi:hypothetical protein
MSKAGGVHSRAEALIAGLEEMHEYEDLEKAIDGAGRLDASSARTSSD